jgi:LacI family transcriptional regulator
MMQRRPRTVTIRDVASEAGVTPMTVSNVLNGRLSSVGEATRVRILEIIERLGYKPYASARRLRSNRRSSIGMVVVDEARDYLRDPFTTNMVAGLSNYATDHGFSVVLVGFRPSTSIPAPLLNQIETDALCVILSGDASLRVSFMERLRQLHQPIVFFQEHERPPMEDVCLIRQDDFAGGQAVAAHLQEQHAPRSVFFLRPHIDWPAISERERGLRAGMPSGVGIIPVDCGNESLEATQDGLKIVLQEHACPDAIVGGNDQMAMAAIRFFDERGVKTPGTIRVTGFNGFDIWRYGSPRLTTVLSSAYEIGWRAGKELLNRLDTGVFPQSEIVLPVVFSRGESS